NGLGAVDDVLAWQAGHIRTGAADHRALDDDGFLALARERPGKDLARDAAANDQVSIVLDTHDDAPFRRQNSLFKGSAVVAPLGGKAKAITVPSPGTLSERGRNLLHV